MPVHLVVTANLDRAREDLESADNMQARGTDRGFLPTGKEILIMDENAVNAAYKGLQLSGHEYRLSNLSTVDQTAMSALLTTVTVTP